MSGIYADLQLVVALNEQLCSLTSYLLSFGSVLLNVTLFTG